MQAQFAYSPSTGASYVYLSNTNVTMMNQDPAPNAVSGAFVLVSNDPGNGARLGGTMNGRIFRLGPAVSNNLPGDITPQPPSSVPPDFDVFQLQPGMDLKDATEESSGSQTLIYMMGRAPVPATGGLTGANQDIAVMSAMIRINTAAN